MYLNVISSRRRQKQDPHNRENRMYGATEVEVKLQGQKANNPKVTGRVLNIYTNPTEHVDQMLHLAANNEEEVMMLMSSGGECNGSDLDEENIKNQQLEDASQYLEPQVCMAHRPLPDVELKLQGYEEIKPSQGQGPCHDKVKVKRKPQRFVRPKSPVPVNSSSKEPHHAKVKDSSKVNPKGQCQGQVKVDYEMVEHHYEDAEDVDENVYAEIPGDNIYETLDEMKKSLATMGEAEA